MYLINKISFLFNYFSVNTEAQPFSLPMSVTSAIIELKTKDVIGFKVILSKEKAQFARISVNKLKEGSTIRYLFSGFYKNIKFTKFFNYEDLIQNLRAITIFKRNPELKEDMPFEILEKNFIESESVNYKEYILDFIYKYHPEELF